jgi:hypothetical protein
MSGCSFPVEGGVRAFCFPSLLTQNTRFGPGMGLFALGQRHNDTVLKHLASVLRNLHLASGLLHPSGALMQKLASFSLFIAIFCVSLGAGPFHPQTLLPIPVQSGQQISSIQVDSQGNTIVAALVTPAGHYDVNGVVMKVDPQGNEIFSLLLPGQSVSLIGYAGSTPLPLVLALDKNDNIYVGGPTPTPSSYPFTSILSSNGAAGISGFLIKVKGTDGTMAYAAALGGYPTSLTVDASGEPLFTLSSIVQLPVTPGAYSSGSPSPPAAN